jgi:tRNA threonylcarbamoyladenosine biosynthesis protein TsaB
MAIILNIDTSTETASVCLAKDGKVLLLQKNDQQKDHAAWLHVAIKQITVDATTELSQLNAIAVTIGPGSYTGLRVGLAAAKGICYALENPLIAVNTLLVMANAVKNVYEDSREESIDFFCPMIDARRMEVFTALYTNNLEVVKEPMALIIDQNSFADELSSKTICFSGTGSAKFKKVINHPNAKFSPVISDSSAMSALTDLLYSKKQFADLAYIEPLYLKEFYTPTR